MSSSVYLFFFFQAEDGIRDLVRARGLGDVYKRQDLARPRRLERIPMGIHVDPVVDPATVDRLRAEHLSLIHI